MTVDVRPALQSFVLPGPAGDIQAVLENPLAPGAPVSRFAVVCHPHPQFGGTMDNKVVYTLARAFQQLGLPTLRFNFRGVGRSQGAYADGIGETEDAIAVIDWGRTQWPDAQLWLAGFSFGSFVAMRAAAQRAPGRLVAVAPPVQRFDFSEMPRPACPWLVVQGDRDEVVDPAAVLAWAGRLAVEAGSVAGGVAPTVVTMQGAGHYFHGKLIELKNTVLDVVESPGAALSGPQDR